jgi:lysophospholipase L1-like esterase
MTRAEHPSSRRGFRGVAAAAVAALVLTLHPTLAQQKGPELWVSTWATAVVGRPQSLPPSSAQAAPPPGSQTQGQAAPPPAAFIHFNNQTLRQVVRTSIGGPRVRAVLSNAFGTTPLAIGAAHIALRGTDAAIVPASGRTLTFSGRPAIGISAGAVVFSDPVDLAVPPMADLAIDVYLPGNTDIPSPLTMHNAALQTNYLSGTGNHAGSPTLPVVATMQNWIVLSRVEVAAQPPASAIVAFGDSITDGSRSTPDTNNRWPNHLARRLLAASMAFGVVNAGIGGNRVLSEGTALQGMNALARFDRDALTVTGATHVIVMEGLNDIGNARENATPSAEDIIAGHQQLAERARSRGLKVYGATLTPFEGANYFTQVGEMKRQAVNRWIRSGRAYDGVIDFDAATRDPGQVSRFLPQYDSGDHLHPNDAGYRAMAEAIDLALFKATRAISSR